MPPRKASILVEEIEEQEVEEVAPKFRRMKYLGPEVDYKCFATSPPLEFVNRICEKVPESVAQVIVKNKKGKNRYPLFKDVTPGVSPLVDPETDPGLPELSDEELSRDR